MLDDSDPAINFKATGGEKEAYIKVSSCDTEVGHLSGWMRSGDKEYHELALFFPYSDFNCFVKAGYITTGY